MRFQTLAVAGVTFLAFVAFKALADPAYDCWIGNAGGKYSMQYIRCIEDRPAGQPVEDDDLIAVSLDEIHHAIHWDSNSRAEELFRASPWLLEAGKVTSIRLITYPYEWSWEEGRPHYLVRANLCSKSMDCPVLIRPD